MTIQIVQRPKLGAPCLLVVYCDPSMGPKLVAALPAGSGVALTTEARPAGLTRKTLAKAFGVATIPRLIAAGFSAGCHGLRDLLPALELGEADTVMPIDGVHIREEAGSSMPRAPWQKLFDDARTAKPGTPKVITTHSYLTYTDTMRDDPRTPAVERAYLSTASSIRLLTGWPLEEPSKAVGHVFTTEGRLLVGSWESDPADPKAHGRQLTEVLPAMLRSYITPEHVDTDDVSTVDYTPAWRDPSLSIGLRLVAWCGAELASGVRETPLGSNDSPRIRAYFSTPPFTRDGKPIKLSKTAWCAVAACCGVYSVLLPGETSPLLAYRVSGIELERDAESRGQWAPSKALGRPGDIAIFERGAPGSWERHVTVVVSDDGRELVTVAGNEGPGQWQRTTHATRPLGFVRVDPMAALVA